MKASEQMGHTVTEFLDPADNKSIPTKMKAEGFSSEEIFKLEDRYGAHK